MAPSRTKASSAGLGKALINRKVKENNAPKESGLYTLDDNNPLASVTHERDLDEFLANAALADADFTTERTKMRIVQGPGADESKNPFLLSEQEEKVVKKKQRENQHGLTVPRRPAWTRHTTRQELERQERESFLDWRRDLAKLAENSTLLMTPFERNVQLWRQLWRVLERSHLVVQIVDARNPLGFRCVDLDRYVQEIGDVGPEAAVPGKGKRKSLLLINKADLLTIEQRTMWADYFEANQISYAFFSAANAAALQEQADRQRRRAEGEDEPVASGADEQAEDEEDMSEGLEDEDDVEGSDLEAELEKVQEAADEAALTEAVEQVDLDDDEEEELSTDGEHEDDVEAAAQAELDEKIAAGEKVPVKIEHWKIAAEPTVPESDRTRVMSVTELEDLFLSSAPPLSDFATTRDPNPDKLVVGLVGYPNVGKSSTINALLGSKKVSVSATPGKTKHFQTLNLSPEVTLCDCPGLVFPQFANTQADMIVDGVLPIDQMREYSAPVDLVCRRVPREIIEGTYGIRIDVREVEDGGSGKVGWEEMLSAYAIARGMTRSSFGMPDTSRAARYVLKDYVVARLLYAHPPPGIDPEEFMSSSYTATLARLEAEFLAGKKRAPATHVVKNADTFVAPASGGAGDASAEGTQAASTKAQRQATSRQVKQSAASAPGRSGREKSSALDEVYFTASGPAPRPVVKGRTQGPVEQSEGIGYSRNTAYPHQRRLGPDGMPLMPHQQGRQGGLGGKKQHFKVKEGKKRSGAGYD